MRKLIGTGLVFFLLISCGRQPIEKFESVNQMTWKNNSPGEFVVNIKDPGEYRLYLQLRYSEDYNYSNIWVSLTKKEEGSSKVEKARFNIPLFDVEGKPFGSFAGKFFDRSFPDAEVDGQKLILKFEKAGTYILTLQQNMRLDDLKGIKEVGIRLKAVKE